MNQVLDANGDGDVDFAEFNRCHCKLSSLMFPAFRLRRLLREPNPRASFGVSEK